MSISYFMTEEHDMFRKSVDDFVKAKISPNILQWEKDGRVDKQLYKDAAEIPAYYSAENKNNCCRR